MIFILIYNLIFMVNNSLFDIAKEEYSRIISLHENATKNLYLFNEQKDTTVTKEISMGKQSFPKGMYSIERLNPSSKKELDSKLQEIASFAKENDGTKINVQIEVGESKVTPFDREKNVELGEGELARLRGEKIKEYLTKYFEVLVNSKYLSVMPNIPNPTTNVELGTQKHKYIKGVDDPADPKYLDDQYIKFIINLSAKKKVDSVKCLLNLLIDVSYYKKQNPKFTCRGNHTCDDAVFEIYLNNTSLGIANLNNKNCNPSHPNDCDRIAKFIVNNQIVEKLISDPSWNDKLILSTKCLTKKDCHTSVQEVKIVDGTGKEIYHGCVNPKASRGDASFKILAVWDVCGKPLEGTIEDNLTADEIKTLSDKIQIDKSDKTDKFLEKGKKEGFIALPNVVRLTRNIFTPKDNWTKILNFSNQGDTTEVEFEALKSFVLRGIQNPYGRSLYNQNINKGDVVKVKFDTEKPKIRSKKLEDLVAEGLIQQISNQNAYYVIGNFKDKGIEYPSNIIIIPTSN